ncbi:sulfotransferase domain-containing protein [Desulfolithobacter sp.]
MTYCLQAGFPKSGNFLLHTILREILEQNNLFTSYRAGCSLPEDIDEYITTFQGVQADCIRINSGKLHLVVPHPSSRFLPIDNLESFLNQAAIIWTHQEFDKSLNDLFKSVPCWFYIIRDGRDAINSLLHYVTSPIALKRNPHYTINNVTDLLKNYDYFANHVLKWKQNIHSWTNSQKQMSFIFFEKLISEKETVIASICNALNLHADTKRIIAKTDLQHMSGLSPAHIRCGVHGDWKHYFNRRHKDIFKDIAGQTLIDMGYEKDLEW